MLVTPCSVELPLPDRRRYPTSPFALRSSGRPL